MSSTPFHSFDAAAGSTLNAASASYGATSDGDQVDDMLADLAAELSDESYGAGASTVRRLSADAIWQDFIPTQILSGRQFSLGGAGSVTDDMALAIATSFANEVNGKEGGWPGDAQGRKDVIDKAVKDAMFAPGSYGKYAPLIALEYAKSRSDLFPQYEDDLLSLVTRIWTGSSLAASADWSISDVDESIKEIVLAASKELAAKENPADQLGITSEISLSQGDINELAVVLWLANELDFNSYGEIASKLSENQSFAYQDTLAPELIINDPSSGAGYGPSPGDYSEVAPEPPASGGFGMPRPQTILAFGYLLSAGGPLFQAAFGRKS